MSSTFKLHSIAAAVVAVGAMAIPLGVEGQGYPGEYRFGTAATQADIDAWNRDVRPDGMGLPPGSGTFEKGQKLFADRCAVCHGQNLEGIHDPNLPQGGGPALIGGRGSLRTPTFKITVESYWPYASTLFDYILRAMPYTAPSSLEPDQVYSLVAFILGRANIIDTRTVMDAKSLPKVQMPNRNGFYPDNRPYPVKRYD